MLYEVVDPAERDERGLIYATLTQAMTNASPTLEVWELADDEVMTRMVRCWPDPDPEPPALTREEETARIVRDSVGRGQREAAALVAEHSPVFDQRVHAVVAAAWSKGYVAGFQAACEITTASLADVLEDVTT